MEILQYLYQVATIDNLFVILGGTLLGLVFGATPGLNPTMAVVLLVPVTFHMTPVVGLILLGSVYSGAVAGGSISAILINIPGAPPNVATVMDGYPLAKKGQAQLALNLSFVSSMVGGIIGCIILLFFAVPLAELAMSFRPAEMFWTSVVGITIMGGLSSKGIAKGLYSGCMGIMLSFVGLSAIHGTPRFVFTDSLMGGVNFATAMIGLFAIPQIFSLVEELYKIQGEIVVYERKKGVLGKTIRELLRNLKAVITSSIVGIIIGIIPGAGGQIAGIVSYEQVKRSSKDPTKFGTGNPEGVIAAECANNAMVGPSLIPTLTMGIPGSATAAVLMGGLLIHGLYPGPDLFRQHADLTYTFMLALLFAQVPMGIFGVMLARYSHFVLRISNQVMICGVLILSVFGAFAIQNSMEDVLIMFILGVLMYLGGKIGFIPAPLVLGLVLGAIIEDNLLKGLMIAEASSDIWTYFFTGTINQIMIGICVISIVWAIWGEWKKSKKTALRKGGQHEA